jgi:hypothetical protein
MARRTLSIDDDLDQWVTEDLEYGDSYTEVVEDALRLMKRNREESNGD